MTGPATLTRLAALARCSDDSSVRALGQTLEAWIAADNPAPLEQVLGVAYTAGRNWRRDRALARRNGHVVAYAEATGETPRQIAAQWRRYASTAWPRHRHMEQVPSSIANTPAAHLWFAMMADPAKEPIALSDRQIVRLLKADAGVNAGDFADQ